MHRARIELQARGQVPCFIATAVENYRDPRLAYVLEDADILQIAGMMIVPTESDADGEPSPAFLMFSVDSELTLGAWPRRARPIAKDQTRGMSRGLFIPKPESTTAPIVLPLPVRRKL